MPLQGHSARPTERCTYGSCWQPSSSVALTYVHSWKESTISDSHGEAVQVRVSTAAVNLHTMNSSKNARIWGPMEVFHAVRCLLHMEHSKVKGIVRAAKWSANVTSSCSKLCGGWRRHDT
jgi:hypothetical protein